MKRKGLSSMHTVAVVSVGAAWLLSLVTLSLNLAGVRRWHGGAARLRSVGGLLMFTGGLIDLLIHWAARPWAVGLLGMLLILPGAACAITSLVVGGAEAKSPTGRSGTTGQSVL
jgi:hypothetical protein